MDKSVFLGVDIGGTKVAAGLVSTAGEILYKTRTPMNAKGTAQDAMAGVFAAIDTVLAQNPGVNVKGIGVSSPGPLDPRTGVVINPPNLTCWRNFPLAAEVQKKYSLPTHVDNDANAAGLAEAVWGAAKGYSSVFYATLGTGIGTGIIFDQKLYLGRTGAAGEGGHVTIDFHGPVCGCGKRGCIEAMASGTGIANRARLKVKDSGAAGAKMLALAGGDVAQLTSEMVAQAWREGDPLATEVLRETAQMLAIWFGNMIDVLDPDVIVVGGGVSTLMADWFGEIKSTLPKWCLNSRCSEVPIVQAKYGIDSGVAGAAALCFEGSANATCA
jgi:glucokinase